MAVKAGQQAAKVAARLGKSAPKNVDDLINAGKKLDRNGLTKAGRALQKHGDRAGSKFSQVKGSAKVKNEQGQKFLEEIVKSKNLKVISKPNGVKQYRDLNTGRGAAFNRDGTFRGFLD